MLSAAAEDNKLAVPAKAGANALLRCCTEEGVDDFGLDKAFQHK